MPDRTPWDHARAALLVFHLVVITIAAAPVPVGELTDERFADARVRRDLAPWTRLIQNVGLADSEDDAMAWVWAQGRRLESVYRVASAPGRRYLGPIGSRQSWRMFSSPKDRFGRFEVLGRTEDGGWTRLYLERGEPDYDPWLMEHARVRSLRIAFVYGRYPKDFRRFATWWGRRILAEQPDLVEVRVQMRKVQIPPPGSQQTGWTDRGLLRPPVEVGR